MTQMTKSETDLGGVTATPVNVKWIWSMLLFLVICILMASLCNVILGAWDQDMKNLSMLPIGVFAFDMVS